MGKRRRERERERERVRRGEIDDGIYMYHNQQLHVYFLTLETVCTCT